MQAILLPCGLLLLADGARLLKASVADGKTAHKNKKSANVTCIIGRPRPHAEEMARALLLCRSIAAAQIALMF